MTKAIRDLLALFRADCSGKQFAPHIQCFIVRHDAGDIVPLVFGMRADTRLAPHDALAAGSGEVEVGVGKLDGALHAKATMKNKQHIHKK